MVTTDKVTGSDLLTSIALVRELLKDNPCPFNTELSVAEQSRYESSLMVEEEQKAHREIVEDLQFRMEQAKHEARQEKIIRLSLEETNEALELHRAELAARLDALSTSTAPPFSQAEADHQHAESIKMLESHVSELNLKLAASQKEVDEAKSSANIWKSNYYQSERQVKELHVQLATIKKEHQAMHDRQEYLLRDEESKFESFQKRLEDSVAARRFAKDELQSIRGTHPEASDAERARTSEIAEWKLKYEEALASMKIIEDKATRMEDEISALQRKELALSLSPEISDEDREVMAKMVNTIIALNALYADTRRDARRGKIAKGPADCDTPTLANSEGIFSFENAKSQLNHHYVALQIKVEECVSEFKRIREDIKTAELAAEKSESSLRQSEVGHTKVLGGCSCVLANGCAIYISLLPLQPMDKEDDTAPREKVVDLATKQVVGKKKALVIKSKLGLEKREATDADGATAKRTKRNS